MELFLFALLYIFIVFVGIYISVSIFNLLPEIKEHKKQIDKIENELYCALRDLQFKSKIFAQAIEKIIKQKKSIIIESISFLLVNLLPFKRIKNGILIYKLLKKLAKQ